jgi:hypothetical protein
MSQDLDVKVAIEENKIRASLGIPLMERAFPRIERALDIRIMVGKALQICQGQTTGTTSTPPETSTTEPATIFEKIGVSSNELKAHVQGTFILAQSFDINIYLFQEYMRIYNRQVRELRKDLEEENRHLPSTERYETHTLMNESLIPLLFPEIYLAEAKNNLTRSQSPIVISSDSDCTDY